MGQIKVTKYPIAELNIIEPAVHGNSKGYFIETYNRNDMHEAGLDMVFVKGYAMADSTPLNLSEKDQKWQGLKDTFRFKICPEGSAQHER